PLRPITPTISPRETDMLTPCRIGVAPYPAHSPDTSRMRSVGMSLTQIDFRDLLVFQNRLEAAARKNLAKMQNGDALGDLAHERHVVLDDQDRHAFGIERLDQFAGLVGLLRRHAG